MNLKPYLQKSLSYDEYWSLFENLVKNNTSTGQNKTQEMADYTKLNFQRSRRVHKQFQALPELQDALENIDSKITWLAITEPWCGDASQNLPVFHELSKINKNISFKLVLRDENPVLMDSFLTNGTRSIPKLLQFDEAMNISALWGPRPEPLQKMMMAYKINPHVEKQQFYEEMQAWYNLDRGKTLQSEILEMIKRKKIDA